MSTQSFMKMHPLVAAAAASVIVVSLVGTAAIMDWLPGSKSKETPAMSTTLPAATDTQPAAAGASEQAAAAAAVTAPTRKAQAAPHKPKAPSHATAPQSAPPQAMTGQPVPPVAQAAAVCEICGKVEGVRTVEVATKPSGVGVVAGAVVGGLLGNQVGGGTGKTLATVAGAVGGGYAGNEIEKRTRKGTSWEVDVRMENGEKKSFRYEAQPSWRAGDRVKVVDGTLAAN